MTITIRLTKVEVEMLKELQKKDKRYKSGIEVKMKSDLKIDFSMIMWSIQNNIMDHTLIFIQINILDPSPLNATSNVAR